MTDKKMNEEIRNRLYYYNIRSFTMPDDIEGGQKDKPLTSYEDSEPNLFIFRIDDGETHWVCAENSDEAIEIHAKTFGYEDVKDYIEDYSETDYSGTSHFRVDIYRLPDDEKFFVRMGELKSDEKIEKTAKQWTEDGKRFVASTVF